MINLFASIRVVIKNGVSSVLGLHIYLVDCLLLRNFVYFLRMQCSSRNGCIMKMVQLCAFKTEHNNDDNKNDIDEVSMSLVVKSKI